MSYDISIYVKVDGIDKYAEVATPEYSSPTYNLGKLFRVCMDWDYSQVRADKDGLYKPCYYRCDKIIHNVNHGIEELRLNPDKYTHLLPANGWGTISNAIRTLESLRDCIYEQAEDIPIDHLYMRW